MDYTRERIEEQVFGASYDYTREAKLVIKSLKGEEKDISHLKAHTQGFIRLMNGHHFFHKNIDTLLYNLTCELYHLSEVGIQKNDHTLNTMERMRAKLMEEFEDSFQLANKIRTEFKRFLDDEHKSEEEQEHLLAKMTRRVLTQSAEAQRRGDAHINRGGDVAGRDRVMKKYIDEQMPALQAKIRKDFENMYKVYNGFFLSMKRAMETADKDADSFSKLLNNFLKGIDKHLVDALDNPEKVTIEVTRVRLKLEKVREAYNAAVRFAEELKTLENKESHDTELRIAAMQHIADYWKKKQEIARHASIMRA